MTNKDYVSREAVIEWLKDKDVIKTKNQEENARKELTFLSSVIPRQASKDCRSCKEWNECPCGKEGHTDGTSIGYSIGECKKYEPSVTPQPKIGRWIIIDDCEQFIAKCSECGRIEDSRMINKYPYCHCGAKMEVTNE